jgi:hypothetical protein
MKHKTAKKFMVLQKKKENQKKRGGKEGRSYCPSPQNMRATPTLLLLIKRSGTPPSLST